MKVVKESIGRHIAFIFKDKLQERLIQLIA